MGRYDSHTLPAVAGDGITDDTTSVQAYLDARLPIPPGLRSAYKITTDLIVRNATGYRLIGTPSDQGQATFIASGTNFAKAMLYADGTLDGWYDDWLFTGDGTEQVPAAFKIDYSTDATRSTSANRVANLRVRQLKHVIGYDSRGTGTRQLDGTELENIVLTGTQYTNWTPGVGNGQVGFAFGNGSWGNNYNHGLKNCSAAAYAVNTMVNASSVSVDTSQPAANGLEYWIAAGAQCSFKNIQSQVSGQFLKTIGFGPNPISFEDCVFETGRLPSPFVWADLAGGSFTFKNLRIAISDANGYHQGVMKLNGAGAGRPSVVTADNLITDGPKLSAFQPINARICVRNYQNYNTATGITTGALAGDMQSMYAGGVWTDVS